MTTPCRKCPRRHHSAAIKNETGVEIQEFSLPAGWVAPEHLQFHNCCDAVAAMKTLPKDDVERRLYSTLQRKNIK